MYENQMSPKAEFNGTNNWESFGSNECCREWCKRGILSKAGDVESTSGLVQGLSILFSSVVENACIASMHIAYMIIFQIVVFFYRAC